MSDLADLILNPDVQADLESREIFDPASLDRTPHPFAGLPEVDISGDPIELACDEAVFHGRLGPRMPWEPIP